MSGECNFKMMPDGTWIIKPLYDNLTLKAGHCTIGYEEAWLEVLTDQPDHYVLWIMQPKLEPIEFTNTVGQQ